MLTKLIPIEPIADLDVTGPDLAEAQKPTVTIPMLSLGIKLSVAFLDQARYFICRAYIVLK